MSQSGQVATRPGALQAAQLDYVLLDGSSSMSDKWGQTLHSLEQFIDVLRSQNIASHGILQVFDSGNLSLIHRDAIIGDWGPLTHGETRIPLPGGMTPLYDAINLMCRSLRDLNPPRASIVIATDGEEMGSRYTDATQARALLDWCRAMGWQVTFLGCDFNNQRQAALLGANAANMIGVRKEMLKLAGKTLGEKRANNARTGTDINFTDDEKENFGGYLTHG